MTARDQITDDVQVVRAGSRAEDLNAALVVAAVRGSLQLPV